MAYLGRKGASAPLTSADIPAGSVSAVKVASDVATQAELDAQKTNSSITTLGTVTAGTLGSGVNLKLARNEGLIVKYVSATTVDIDADYLTVFDTNNYAVVLPAVNLTATITTSGANGLDTGSEAAIWYHIYVIYNGTTVASLLSASATSPTMPSGYTYKKYVGAVYNPSSSFRDFYQRGNNVSAAQLIVSSTIFTTSWVARDFAGNVPTTATKIRGEMRSNKSAIVSASIAIASYGSGTGQDGFDQQSAYLYLYNTNNGIQIAVAFDVAVKTAQTLYVKAVYAIDSSSVHAAGWSYDNIV